MQAETLSLNPKRNVSLTAYLHEEGGDLARPSVLILPGGAYRYCSAREADPVAYAYLAAGFQAFILRYSVGEATLWPEPLEDFDLAMELIRRNRKAWHVLWPKIAAVGFSAGGHLAACAASVAKNRPAAAILGYPAIEERTLQMCLPSGPDASLLVHDGTCPCFLFCSRMDEVVPARDTLSFLNALYAHNIAFESHIYAYGPHGASTGDPSITKDLTAMPDRTRDWVSDSISWLREILGTMTQDGVAEPVRSPSVNGDREPFLSADCTIGFLQKNPEAADVLKPLFDAIARTLTPGQPVAPEAQAMPQPSASSAAQPAPGNAAQMAAGLEPGYRILHQLVRNFPEKTLAQVEGFCGLDKETVQAANEALRQIPNPEAKW